MSDSLLPLPVLLPLMLPIFLLLSNVVSLRPPKPAKRFDSSLPLLAPLAYSSISGRLRRRVVAVAVTPHGCTSGDVILLPLLSPSPALPSYEGG